MALITFMSDFGTEDHYVAAVKAKILSVNSGINIIDISHNIKPFDIAHASYVLGAVFRDFPKGTVHLCAVDTVGQRNSRYIAIKLEDHFFVGNDNGIYSLISEKAPELIVELKMEQNGEHTYPAKNILAKAAALLANGSKPEAVGTITTTYERRISRKSRATKRQISGNVIHIDHYGNLITNIEAEAFNVLKNGRKFTVQFARERIGVIHQLSNEAEDGDCFLIFNSQGYLEIGINKGNASELLGLKHDSPVNILFDPEG